MHAHHAHWYFVHWAVGLACIHTSWPWNVRWLSVSRDCVVSPLWLGHTSKVGMATSCDQILQEHAVWLTGQFGCLVFVSLKSYCMCIHIHIYMSTLASKLRLHSLHFAWTCQLHKDSQLTLKSELSACCTAFAERYSREPSHTDWPLPQLILTSSLPVRSEPRAKRTCSFAFVDVRNGLTIFVSQSACAQTHFHCTKNWKIISFLCVQIN